jgi:hypothetical protein
MRHVEELSDHLARERIWRVREIRALVALASRSALSTQEKEIYCRADVTLMYAHWEGFVKRASVHYLKHISFQRIRLDEMADFVLTIYVNQSVSRSGDRLSAAKMANILIRQHGLRPKLGWKKVISTESNLSSVVLSSIITVLGLEKSLFETKYKFLDSTLLKERNAIAHGEKGDLDVQDLEEMSIHVIALLTTFRDAIENCAVLRSYVRSAPPAVSSGAAVASVAAA